MPEKRKDIPERRGHAGVKRGAYQVVDFEVPCLIIDSGGSATCSIIIFLVLDVVYIGQMLTNLVPKLSLISSVGFDQLISVADLNFGT